MLHERDWLMRVVKQVVELIARALKLADEKKKDEAVATLEAACGTALGMDFASLAFVDSASAAALLREPVKVRGFALLLEALGRVHEKCGDEAKARSKYQHALELACEALALREGDEEAAALVRRVVSQVDVGLVPERYRARITRATG